MLKMITKMAYPPSKICVRDKKKRIGRSKIMEQDRLFGLIVHKESSIPNLVKLNQILIIIALFRLI